MDARRLVTADADDLLAMACSDDRDDLTLSEHLRKRWSADLVSLALTQRALRARARGKLVAPDTWLLTREGLEQATATAVARHRAASFLGMREVVDVCCGIGGDGRELAAASAHVVGIDRDPLHLTLAARNAGIHPVLADAARLPVRLGSVDAVLVDPARRAEGSRRRGHAESSPPLEVCFGWGNQTRVTIKAAPGLDLEVVPPGWAIEAVAIGRDLKELALWSPPWTKPLRQATVLRVDPEGLTVSAHSMAQPFDPTNRVEVTEVGAYLFDPSPAVTRTGLVQALGSELGASMIDPQIAFLTSDRAVRTPFARTLQVKESLPWSLKPVKARLRAHGIGQVEVRQRGLTAGDVDALRKRLATDGPDGGVLLLTRLGDKPWAIICTES